MLLNEAITKLLLIHLGLQTWYQFIQVFTIPSPWQPCQHYFYPFHLPNRLT